MRCSAVFASCLVLLGTHAWAAESSATADKAEVDRLVKLRDSLHPLHGEIALPEAKATLRLGEKYYFLSASDARRMLTEGWDNPPASVNNVLGVVMPEGKTFLDDTWGAVVTYQNTFYIPDAVPQQKKYDKLLEDMHRAEDEDNIERQKEGFSPIHLIGWAEAPTYDSAHHDLIWARDVVFGNEDKHTLNYDVRHLGRYGVLSVNVISEMDRLPSIKNAAADLANTAEFDAGSRYADHKMMDKRAGYGLAGLIAAGAGLAIAKKAGLLAIFALFFKKAAVLIIAAFGGVAAWFRKLFQRKAQ